MSQKPPPKKAWSVVNLLPKAKRVCLFLFVSNTVSCVRFHKSFHSFMKQNPPIIYCFDARRETDLGGEILSPYYSLWAAGYNSIFDFFLDPRHYFGLDDHVGGRVI